MDESKVQGRKGVSLDIPSRSSSLPSCHQYTYVTCGNLADPLTSEGRGDEALTRHPQPRVLRGGGPPGELEFMSQISSCWGGPDR